MEKAGVYLHVPMMREEMHILSSEQLHHHHDHHHQELQVNGISVQIIYSNQVQLLMEILL